MSLRGFVNETDVETAGDDSQEISVRPTELFPYEDYGTKHAPLVGRLRRIIEAVQPQGVQRLRKKENGEEIEIDINAAVAVLTGRSSGARRSFAS